MLSLVVCGWDLTGFAGSLLILLEIVAWITSYHKGLVKQYGDKEMVYHDVMNWIIYRSERLGVSLGLWSLTHFMIHFELTVFADDHPSLRSVVFILFLSAMGLIWEFVEDLISKMIGKKRSVFEHKHTRRIANSEHTDIVYSEWWAGSLNDVVVNFLGCMLGCLLRWHPSLSSAYTPILILVVSSHCAMNGVISLIWGQSYRCIALVGSIVLIGTFLEVNSGIYSLGAGILQVCLTSILFIGGMSMCREKEHAT